MSKRTQLWYFNVFNSSLGQGLQAYDHWHLPGPSPVHFFMNMSIIHITAHCMQLGLTSKHSLKKIKHMWIILINIVGNSKFQRSCSFTLKTSQAFVDICIFLILLNSQHLLLLGKLENKDQGGFWLLYIVPVKEQFNFLSLYFHFIPFSRIFLQTVHRNRVTSVGQSQIMCSWWLASNLSSPCEMLLLKKKEL